MSNAAVTSIVTDQLPVWTGAPKGIAKLRELILELAVRGLLVPQDPRDEPASKLLTKIAAEKAKLVKEGKIKAPKLLAPITDDEKPFELPEGWEWVRFGEMSTSYRGHNPPKSLFRDEPAPGYVRFIQQRDFRSDEYKVYVPISRHLKLVAKGEIVMAAYGNVGNTCRTVEGAFNVAIAKVMEIFPMSRDYIELLIESKLVRGALEKVSSRVAVPSMSSEYMRNLPILLPPLDEQHRIVAKVDELMSLCDRLEAEQESSATAHAQLVDVLLEALTRAPDAASLHAAWMRVGEYFGSLFTTEESVSQLKQTILQLAVMGRLVPQNPKDEPASKLLSKIAAEKAKLVKEGKIKAPKPLPPITDDEKPFVLPDGWEWVRFQDITNIASNLVDPKNYLNLPHVAPDNIEKETGKLLPYNTVGEDSVMSSNHLFFAGQVLYSKIRPNLAKVVVIDFDGLCSADMYPIDSFIDSCFLKDYMLSSVFLAQSVKTDTRVAMPKINQTELSLIVIPLPPLSEQHRIVAKVDELMSLCDRLSERLSASRSTRQQLADAVVEQAVG